MESKFADATSDDFDAKDMLGELSDMAQSKEEAGGRDEAAKSEPLARRKLAKSGELLRPGGPTQQPRRRPEQGAPPRERFVETAYWNPSVVTGADGKAKVTFKAPTALSAYQFTARGVTGSDTLVGQTTAAITVRKDFFVDLKVPSALTQGDRPRFMRGCTTSASPAQPP